MRTPQYGKRTHRPMRVAPDVVSRRHVEYERRKVAWLAANPGASSSDYQIAMTRLAAELAI